MTAEGAVSVVIPTFERVDRCKQAIASALDQQPAPLEVLVCDNASEDGTRKELEAWAAREPRLRYLRLAVHSDGPANGRNLGIDTARGEWVALLDDDDVWLPEKLSVQAEAMRSGACDVIATDAERLSGGPYLGLETRREPGRAEFLEHNPIVTSSAVVRRSVLREVGGFRERAGRFPLHGVEDFDLWLRLLDADARFVLLPDRTVLYDDSAANRLSRAEASSQARLALLRWSRWLTRRERGGLPSALRATADAVRWRLRSLSRPDGSPRS